MSLLPRPSKRSLYFQFKFFSSHSYTRHFTTSDEPAEAWIRFNGEARDIPVHTARARYHGWMEDEAGVCPPALSGPAWTDVGKAYLGYGVDIEKVRLRHGLQPEAWMYSSYSDEDEFLDPADRDLIFPALLDKIRKELKIALELVEFLDHRGGSKENVVDRSYTGNSLAIAVGSAAIVVELRKARRAMDERLAAINFALLRAEPDVRAYVERTYSAYIKKWRLLKEMRGLYIDFRDFDANKAHLNDHLRLGLSIAYPTDLKYRPRLTEWELRYAEGIRTAEDFAAWFAETSTWPEVDKSLPAPLRHYGRTAEERNRNLHLRQPRPERLDDLTHHARIILADVLHPRLTPLVNPLGDAPVMVVGNSRLIVDSLSELRMMTWAAKYRASNVCEIIGEALLRGWAFQIVYPESYLDELARQDRYRDDPRVREWDLLTPSVESRDFDILYEWDCYLERALALLSRPNARAFLRMGGIYWRLALLLGGENVLEWRNDVVGPSSSIVVNRIAPQEIHGYWGDQVTEEEQNVLVGLCRERFDNHEMTWFPPQDLLIKHRFHDGEWSELEELLVQERYSSLQRRETRFRPLSASDWDLELSTYKPAVLLRDSFVPPTTFIAEMLLSDAQIEFGAAWNHASLSEIDATLTAINEE